MIFTVEGKIKGKGRPRFNGSLAYTPKGTVSYENWIKLCYKQQIDDKPFEAKIPLKMDVMALYGIPKSYSKKKEQKCINGVLRPTKFPDGDNILKCVADALNGLAYADDKQIVEMSIKKLYIADNEKIEVMIEEV